MVLRTRKRNLLRWLLSIVAASTLTVAVPSIADANTHSPCTGHTASIPKVTDITNDVTTIMGGGGILGCPAVTTTASESVTINVCLQLNVDGNWENQACSGPITKSWNRYWRFARQDTTSVGTICQVGNWRTDITGGDGFNPTEWYSSSVYMAAGDDGVCGGYGGEP